MTLSTSAAKTSISLLLLVILVLLFLYRFILFNKAMIPLDLIYFYYPWSAAKPAEFVQPSCWILFDEVLEFLPWRKFARDSLSTGLLPLWNPYNFCGHPFIGCLQTAVFYPFSLLMFILDETSFPAVNAILHMFISALGMFFLCRQIQIGHSGAILASIAFAFSGFQVLWLGHPHSKVSAWLPWLFLGLEKIVERAFFLGSLLIIFTTTMQIIAGHIETSLHIYTAAFIYLFLRIIAQWKHLKFHSIKPVILVIVSVATGIAISSSQLFPFFEYLYNSSAYQAREHGVWTEKYLPLELFICQLIPKYFGAERDNNYRYPGFNLLEISSGYVGILSLILAFLAILFNRRNGFLIPLTLILLFSWGVSYGIPVLFDILHSIPLFKMSYNFRFLLISAFSLSALCGFGWDFIIGRLAKQSRKSSLIPLFVFIIFLSLMAINSGIKAKNLPAEYSLYALSQVQIFSFLILLSALAIFLGIQIKFKRFATMIAIAILFADLFIFGKDLNPAMDKKYLYPTSDIIKFLHFDKGYFRILPFGFVVPPHINMSYGLYDLRGNDALTPFLLEQYLAVVDKKILAPDLLPALRLIQLREIRSPLFDILNTKYILTPPEVFFPNQPNYRLVFQSLEGNIYLNETAKWYISPISFKIIPSLEQGIKELNDPQFDPFKMLLLADYPKEKEFCSLTTDPLVEMKKNTAHQREFTIKSEMSAFLFLPETLLPGWKAYLDGKDVPIYQANLAFMAVEIPPGRHNLSFRYQPFSFRLGLFLSLSVTAFLLIIIIPIGLKKLS